MELVVELRLVVLTVSVRVVPPERLGLCIGTGSLQMAYEAVTVADVASMDQRD